jgi:fructosamine-3-kinase
MEPAVRAWLEQGRHATVDRYEPVSGGCIHRAGCVRFSDGSRCFLKTNRASALEMFEAEVDGLRALARAADGDPVVPRPLLCGRAGASAALALDWLPLRSGGAGAALGRALAELHRRSAGCDWRSGAPGGATAAGFGWWRDNHIGSAPQANGWLASWGTFFRDRRLRPQLAAAGLSEAIVRGLDRFLEALPAWLDAHHPNPCLVHGDLWSGNAGQLSDGRPCLFDPAVHLADREVDLAMARLFGGFPQAMFAAYEECWPLPAGHESRRDVYNLYHLLNHANLFGGSYEGQARASLHRAMALVRDA